MPDTLLPRIHTYCDDLTKHFVDIPEPRKEALKSLSSYLEGKYKKGETPQVIVICTHNSRRSHLGQVWLAAGATYYGLPEINTFSGGTEATAFNSRAVATLSRVGFEITAEQPGTSNPRYQLKWESSMEPYEAYSTKFDETPNPTNNFGAIMVCDHADENCPVILGADFRIALPFEDPKAYDETALESQKYDERCQHIGTEMLYVLSQIQM